MVSDKNGLSKDLENSNNNNVIADMTDDPHSEDEDIEQESKYLRAYRYFDSRDGCFDVRGIKGDKEIHSTFYDNGWEVCLNNTTDPKDAKYIVGGFPESNTYYNVKDFDQDIKIKQNLQLARSGTATKINFTVKNDGSATKNGINLSVAADVEINEDDEAPIIFSKDKLSFAMKNRDTGDTMFFSCGDVPFNTIWAGYFGEWLRREIRPLYIDKREDFTDGDSAVNASWINFSLAPNEEKTFSFYLSVVSSGIVSFNGKTTWENDKVPPIATGDSYQVNVKNGSFEPEDGCTKDAAGDFTINTESWTWEGSHPAIVSSPGEYIFEVSQKDTGVAGVTYDTTKRDVVVTATQSSSGQIIVDTKYYINGQEVQNLDFKNKYGGPAYAISVTADPTQGGIAKADKQRAMAGDEVTLTATPNEIYFFEKWEVVTPETLIVEDDNTFTMPEENIEIVAHFVEKEVPSGGGDSNSESSTTEIASTGDNTIVFITILSYIATLAGVCLFVRKRYTI